MCARRRALRARTLSTTAQRRGTKVYNHTNDDNNNNDDNENDDNLCIYTYIIHIIYIYIYIYIGVGLNRRAWLEAASRRATSHAHLCGRPDTKNIGMIYATGHFRTVLARFFEATFLWDSLCFWGAHPS